MSDRKKAEKIMHDLGIEDVIPPDDRTSNLESEPFLDGFSYRVLLGGFFIALFMLPGFIYMGLSIGTNIGAGAEWVIALLIFELARRSYQELKRQELMMILHMCGSLTSLAGHVTISGGVFATLIFHYYQKNSSVFESFNLTEKIPDWFAPSFNDIVTRDFLQEAWVPAIIVALLTFLFSRIQYFGIGYIVFRITSDYEKLPYPMSRISSEGIMALTDSNKNDESSWRWGVFAFMAMIGVVWGFFYMGIPSISNAIFGTRTEIIPIPFLDLTKYTENIFPAALWGIGFDLTLVLIAFVMPKRVTIGIIITSFICHLFLPPIMYNSGIYTQWQKGFSMLDSSIANSLDLWMSVGIGAAISVPITAIMMTVKIYRSNISIDEEKHDNVNEKKVISSDRGDISTWLSISLYLFSSVGFVMLTHGIINLGWLGGIEKTPDQYFPIWILILFSMIWGPIMTYINAKMIGIAGQHISVPYVKEGILITSGYKQPDIWVSPLSSTGGDFSGATVTFKTLELTKTKFTSLFKVELFAFILLTISGLFFFSYLWSVGPIPSDQFPYAQKMWPFITKNAALWYSALDEGNNLVLDALKPNVIGGSLVFFIFLYGILSVTGIPLAYYFGTVSGIGVFPYITIPYAFALIIRSLIEKKVGEVNFRRNKPIMAAGFAAGMGLAGMLIVMVVLIKSAISAIPY